MPTAKALAWVVTGATYAYLLWRIPVALYGAPLCALADHCGPANWLYCSRVESSTRLCKVLGRGRAERERTRALARLRAERAACRR